MKTIIHVNQHVIKENRKKNEQKPVLTCKTYKDNKYAMEADILDDRGNVVAKVVYRPDKPLSCGAHVWIETQNKVVTKCAEDLQVEKQMEEYSDMLSCNMPEMLNKSS